MIAAFPADFVSKLQRGTVTVVGTPVPRMLLQRGRALNARKQEADQNLQTMYNMLQWDHILS
jgi:hypothetical protein